MSPHIKKRAAPEVDLPDELHPVLARIYAARGIQSADELELGLDRLLPFDQLKGIGAAVDLLIASLQAQQKILIVGDYDADGATSTTLLMRMLPRFGYEHVSYLLPNRFEYGYGLSPEIVEVAKLQQPDLIITVDNGIASIEGVATARKAGIDVLITDHHLPGAQLPDANVIVNPNQAGDKFPSKMLAGVGVVFYILMALRKKLRDDGWFESKAIAMQEPNLAEVLDIVALGTVADVVPLDHNNRILVEQGLRRMRAGQCQPGILALIEQAGKEHAFLRSSDLGFSIAPRLNAAGRLDDMSIGVECLLTDDPERARQLAAELDQMNLQRRQISQDMQDEADQMLEVLHLPDSAESSLPNVYCLHQDHWHQGVVGILAGRIKDKMHRPTIVFANADMDENTDKKDAEIKGSARSIAGFHIRDALDAVASENPGLITKFGGHAMAAGLSLSYGDLPTFIEKLNDYASRVLTKDQLEETILTDGELAADDLEEGLARVLEQAGPWGQGYAAPLFEGRFNVVQRRRIGADQRHLKLLLESGGVEVDAVAFSVTDTVWPATLEVVDIVYRLDVNRFRGVESLQLMIEHVV